MYNTNQVTLQQALPVALSYIRAGIIPLFVSPPGVGKTTMAQTIAAELSAQLRHVRLNSIPPEEAVGLQFIDHERKRTVRYAPAWVPAADGTDGNVLVFLDELMQAPDDFRKGIMSALLERYLGDHRIPDNCFFLAAGNSVEDGSNVYELDRATADRFGIIMIRPDFESWVNGFAGEHGVHRAVVGFLRHRPDYFEMTGPDGEQHPDQVIKPSPRSWTKLSDFLFQAEKDGLSDEAVKTGINGKVGTEIGSALWALVGSLRNLPTLEQLIRMSPKDVSRNTPKTMDVMWAYGQAMIWSATDADRTLRIMQLFGKFDEKSTLPMVEFRTNVIEAILKRARTVHQFSVGEEPRIRNLLIEWDHEKRASRMEAPGNDDGVVEMKKVA